ncbi:MAG: type II toxin-antitoxin system prevent-host-death family antitoxin [Pseudolysinimonas sp.]|uniref:type II toxin-antitoxin system Phd/YefM family antitoxin n=1 Tax=Pseudolysinimonas sp. TaxID=2680009 RepID=UPI0032657720
MTLVAARELRNNTADLLRRVARGEKITITLNGVEVAEIIPIKSRGKRRFISKEEFFRTARFADPGLREDLAELAGDTTDDLGLFE